MRANSKEFYFIGFITAVIILLSAHHFNNSSAVNTNSYCKTTSLSGTEGQECVPAYDEVDQELASYPWIEDPTCRHFAVQVKICFGLKIFLTQSIEETFLCCSNSLRRIKRGQSGL